MMAPPVPSLRMRACARASVRALGTRNDAATQLHRGLCHRGSTAYCASPSMRVRTMRDGEQERGAATGLPHGLWDPGSTACRAPSRSNVSPWKKIQGSAALPTMALAPLQTILVAVPVAAGGPGKPVVDVRRAQRDERQPLYTPATLPGHAPTVSGPHPAPIRPRRNTLVGVTSPRSPRARGDRRSRARASPAAPRAGAPRCRRGAPRPRGRGRRRRRRGR